MPATSWTKLRTKTGASDDTDHVAAQSSPAASELFQLGPPHNTGATPIALQFMLVWIDNLGERLTPTAGTTRGTFDWTALKVLSLTDDDSPADAVTVVGDSSTVTGSSGYRIYTIDGITTLDKVWIRLTNIVVPTSGSPTKLQIWIKPLERG